MKNVSRHDDKDQFIYGRQPVIEALRHDKGVEKVYLDRSMHGDFEKEVRSICKQNAIPISRIPVSKFQKWTKHNHQGALAVLSAVKYKTESDLLELAKNSSEDILILDHIKDVRNMGAIARSALCFGFKHIVVPAKGSAEINAMAVKASAGSLIRQNLYRVTNLMEMVDKLRKTGRKNVVLDNRGDDDLKLFSRDSALTVIIGSEGHGVTKEMRKLADHVLTISHSPEFDSLNVAVATGIALYTLQKL